MTKAIVIGSGAGGSFAAMELAKAGWQVTIFEKGPNHFTNLGGQGPFGTVFANDSLAMLQRYFAEPDPEVFPRTWRPNPSAPAQTGSVDELPQVVGGGTVHWDAKVPRFWDIDFQQHSALGPYPGADVADWPFGYHDLAPYYDEVEQLIGVQGDTTTFPDLVRKHAPRNGQYPMPPGPQMRSSTAIAHGAAAVGLHPFPFPMAANSVSGYNGQHACNNCGFCSSFGCPVVARPSALIPLRQALRTGRVELRPETMVTKIELTGNKAKGVSWIKMTDRGPATGTEAADMPDQVPDEVKRDRIERLVECVQRVAVERNEQRVGLVEEVLVEGESRHGDGLQRGRTRRNTTVNFVGDAAPGELVDVLIEHATSTTLRGTQEALVAVGRVWQG